MKSFKALFVFALALAFTAPAFAETQNVKVSGSIDAYGIYRDNYDLAKNDRGITPSTVAGGPSPSVPRCSHGSACSQAECRPSP